MNNLILNFPEGFNPRDKQAKALNAIEKAFENGKKFVIVHADTGVGKTHLAKTLGNVSKDVPAEFERIVRNYSIFSDEGAALVSDIEPFGCYALTITKSLQDQYQMTFDDTGMLKGKSNYQCDVDDTLSVDVAPCIYVANQKNECWKANRCPYYNSRNDMLTSKFSTLNYSMFFSLPNHLKTRQVMVCDEGSELEEQLVSQFTCEVDMPFLMKTNTLVTPFPNDDKNKPKVLSWVNSLMEKVETSCADYKEWFSSNTAKKDIITFIDPDAYCKSLGIKDYEYIHVGTDFEPEKSPIHIMAKQKLNFNNLKTMLPTLMKQIEGILEHHKDEKGIIHTHTHFLTEYIQNNVKTNRFLCREKGVNNEQLLEMHEESEEPTVLVSPSMTYGVDLKGDLARFQIILKAPWLPTKDVRVEKLMKLDKDWYGNQMLKTLVQACGRGVRSEDDFCETYILDGSIFDAINRNKKKLPKFFLDRFN